MRPSARDCGRCRWPRATKSNPVEGVRTHGTGAAHGEAAFRLAHDAACHEVVRDEHLARLGGRCLANAVETAAHGEIVVVHRLVGHDVPGLDGVGVREQPEAGALVALAEHHGAGLGLEAPRHVQAAGVQHGRGEAHSIGAVVVPGHDEHGNAELEDDARQRAVEQRDRLGGRDGAVVEVAGDDQGVGAVLLDDAR